MRGTIALPPTLEVLMPVAPCQRSRPSRGRKRKEALLLLKQRRGKSVVGLPRNDHKSHRSLCLWFARRLHNGLSIAIDDRQIRAKSTLSWVRSQRNTNGFTRKRPDDLVGF